MNTIVSSGLHMRILAGICFLISVSFAPSLLAQPKNGSRSPDERYTFINQFFGAYPSEVPDVGSDPDFTNHVNKNCVPKIGGERVSPAAGVILLDWIAKRAVSAANQKLERYIKEHTATYSTKPAYWDIGESIRWASGAAEQSAKSDTDESCVIVTRLSCSKGSGENTDWKGCTTRLRFAAIMREDQQSLRVLPIAISTDGLEARHFKGNAAVGVNFEIQAISHSSRGGQRWTSGDVPLIAAEFKAEKANPKKNQYGSSKFFEAYPITEESWKMAPLLPMPPNMRRPNTDLNPTVGTFKVTIAQVGRPSAFGKRLADLLSTKEDDLAGALGSALKKAADVD